VAAGFVIHELLGLIGGLILCYFGYRLLMRRVRVPRSETHGPWNSAKRYIKNSAPGVLFSLFGAVAICLTASKALRPQTFASGNSVDLPILSGKEARTSELPAEVGTVAKTSDEVPPGTNNEALPAPMRQDNSTIVQSPASTPALTPTPANGLPADRNALSDNSQLSGAGSNEAGREALEVEPRKADRKILEKERRAAERKRSRLEEMYQNHLISSDAYKRGEGEYKSAIVKYRSAMNASRGVPE